MIESDVNATTRCISGLLEAISQEQHGALSGAEQTVVLWSDAQATAARPHPGRPPQAGLQLLDRLVGPTVHTHVVHMSGLEACCM